VKSLQRIGLALQGGGAYGAFTWGVLDRLLDEVKAGCFEMAAVTGTSAGALRLVEGRKSLLQRRDYIRIASIPSNYIEVEYCQVEIVSVFG
jgi:predicted patatin/cPLA2 family phospholipase